MENMMYVEMRYLDHAESILKESFGVTDPTSEMVVSHIADHIRWYGFFNGARVTVRNGDCNAIIDAYYSDDEAEDKDDYIHVTIYSNDADGERGIFAARYRLRTETVKAVLQMLTML